MQPEAGGCCTLSQPSPQVAGISSAKYLQECCGSMLSCCANRILPFTPGSPVAHRRVCRATPDSTFSTGIPSTANHGRRCRSCSPSRSGQPHAACAPQSNVDDTVKALRSRGLEVAGCACHVGSAEQRKQLVAQCVQVGKWVDGGGVVSRVAGVQEQSRCICALTVWAARSSGSS